MASEEPSQPLGPGLSHSRAHALASRPDFSSSWMFPNAGFAESGLPLQPQNASRALRSEGQVEFSPCNFSLAFCLSAGCGFGVACLGPILRLCCPRREWRIKTGDSLFTSRVLINGKLEWNWYMHMTCTLIPNVFIVINAITMNTKGIREWLATLSICYGLFKKVKHKISWGLRSDVSFSQWTWLQALGFCKIGGYQGGSPCKILQQTELMRLSSSINAVVFFLNHLYLTAAPCCLTYIKKPTNTERRNWRR